MEPSGSERALKASEMDAFAGKSLSDGAGPTSRTGSIGRPRSRADDAAARVREAAAAGMRAPAYAIDDQTAIKVTDGTVGSRLRGALEAVYPQPGSKRIGLMTRAARLGQCPGNDA
jgi:hypothetical protein